MNRFLSQVEGFTPAIDALVEREGLLVAVTYGVAWRFCNMKDKVCRASLETLARMTGLSKATVQRNLAKLVEAGYLKDLTPGLRNRPHVYADTGQAQIIGLVAARVGAPDAGDDDLGPLDVSDDSTLQTETSRFCVKRGVSHSSLSREPMREERRENHPDEKPCGFSRGASAPREDDDFSLLLGRIQDEVIHRRCSEKEIGMIAKSRETYGLAALQEAIDATVKHRGRSVGYITKTVESAQSEPRAQWQDPPQITIIDPQTGERQKLERGLDGRYHPAVDHQGGNRRWG